MALVSLIVLSASWLLILTLLILDFAGIWRQGIARRWQGTGMLIMNGVLLVDTFTEFRDWSYSRLDAVHSITLPTVLAGFVIFGIGIVVQFRERRRETERQRLP